jgi:Family of unknown function (DUF6131)
MQPFSICSGLPYAQGTAWRTVKVTLRTPAAAAARFRGCTAEGPGFSFGPERRPVAGRAVCCYCLEPDLIILGIILLIIGFIAQIAIVWTIGIIVLLVGLILMVLGMVGHAVGGRRHYF